jgi:hypothetical protein
MVSAKQQGKLARFVYLTDTANGQVKEDLVIIDQI